MNKKVIAIISLMAVVAVVLVVMAAKKDRVSVGGQKDATKQQANKTISSQPTGDADMDAINKELDSVNDEDFGDSSLSDAEVGL